MKHSCSLCCVQDSGICQSPVASKHHPDPECKQLSVLQEVSWYILTLDWTGDSFSVGSGLHKFECNILGMKIKVLEF